MHAVVETHQKVGDKEGGAGLTRLPETPRGRHLVTASGHMITKELQGEEAYGVAEATESGDEDGSKSGRRTTDDGSAEEGVADAEGLTVPHVPQPPSAPNVNALRASPQGYGALRTYRPINLSIMDDWEFGAEDQFSESTEDAASVADQERNADGVAIFQAGGPSSYACDGLVRRDGESSSSDVPMRQLSARERVDAMFPVSSDDDSEDGDLQGVDENEFEDIEPEFGADFLRLLLDAGVSEFAKELKRQATERSIQLSGEIEQSSGGDSLEWVLGKRAGLPEKDATANIPLPASASRRRRHLEPISGNAGTNSTSVLGKLDRKDGAGKQERISMSASAWSGGRGSAGSLNESGASDIKDGSEGRYRRRISALTGRPIFQARSKTKKKRKRKRNRVPSAAVRGRSFLQWISEIDDQEELGVAVEVLTGRARVVRVPVKRETAEDVRCCSVISNMWSMRRMVHSAMDGERTVRASSRPRSCLSANQWTNGGIPPRPKKAVPKKQKKYRYVIVPSGAIDFEKSVHAQPPTVAALARRRYVADPKANATSRGTRMQVASLLQDTLNDQAMSTLLPTRAEMRAAMNYRREVKEKAMLAEKLARARAMRDRGVRPGTPREDIDGDVGSGGLDVASSECDHLDDGVDDEPQALASKLARSRLHMESPVTTLADSSADVMLMSGIRQSDLEGKCGMVSSILSAPDDAETGSWWSIHQSDFDPPGRHSGLPAPPLEGRGGRGGRGGVHGRGTTADAVTGLGLSGVTSSVVLPLKCGPKAKQGLLNQSLHGSAASIITTSTALRSLVMKSSSLSRSQQSYSMRYTQDFHAGLGGAGNVCIWRLPASNHTAGGVAQDLAATLETPVQLFSSDEYQRRVILGGSGGNAAAWDKFVESALKIIRFEEHRMRCLRAGMCLRAATAEVEEHVAAAAIRRRRQALTAGYKHLGLDGALDDPGQPGDVGDESMPDDGDTGAGGRSAQSKNQHTEGSKRKKHLTKRRISRFLHLLLNTFTMTQVMQQVEGEVGTMSVYREIGSFAVRGGVGGSGGASSGPWYTSGPHRGIHMTPGGDGGYEGASASGARSRHMQRRIVYVDVGDNIAVVLRVMRKHQVCSVPVYDRGSCVGFINMEDCVQLAVSCAADQSFVSQFFDATVRRVCNSAPNNECAPMSGNLSMMDGTKKLVDAANLVPLVVFQAPVVRSGLTAFRKLAQFVASNKTVAFVAAGGISGIGTTQKRRGSVAANGDARKPHISLPGLVEVARDLSDAVSGDRHVSASSPTPPRRSGVMRTMVDSRMYSYTADVPGDDEDESAVPTIERTNSSRLRRAIRQGKKMAKLQSMESDHRGDQVRQHLKQIEKSGVTAQSILRHDSNASHGRGGLERSMNGFLADGDAGHLSHEMSEAAHVEEREKEAQKKVTIAEEVRLARMRTAIPTRPDSAATADSTTRGTILDDGFSVTSSDDDILSEEASPRLPPRKGTRHRTRFPMLPQSPRSCQRKLMEHAKEVGDRIRHESLKKETGSIVKVSVPGGVSRPVPPRLYQPKSGAPAPHAMREWKSSQPKDISTLRQIDEEKQWDPSRERVMLRKRGHVANVTVPEEAPEVGHANMVHSTISLASAVKLGRKWKTVTEAKPPTDQHDVATSDRMNAVVVSVVDGLSLIAFLGPMWPVLRIGYDSPIAMFDGLIHTDIPVCGMNVPVLQCFRSISLEVTGQIALVDNDGRLVGEVSVTDLRVIRRTTYQSLFMSARSYLLSTQARTELVKPLHVTDQATLCDVIMLMSKHSTGRVFVVNNMRECIPSGVVTVRGVLRQLTAA